MMKNKDDSFYERFNKSDPKATLKQNKTDTKKDVRQKKLNAFPNRFVEAHAALVDGGVTSLDLSNYIYEAVREKLKKDGAL